MIVRMIQNLGNRMEKTQETFNKDLEELKSKQTMMNNTINEIKNSLESDSSEASYDSPLLFSYCIIGEVFLVQDIDRTSLPSHILFISIL